MSIKVREYKGYTISYDPSYKRFDIVLGDEVLDHTENQEGAEKIIDGLSKKAFTTMPAILVCGSESKLGRITSYNPDKKEAWFSPDNEKWGRTKEDVDANSTYHVFYRLTEHNREIMAEIQCRKESIAALSREISNLARTFTERITDKDL